MVSTTAMIGDTADHVELLTGERTDGSCFAGLTFTSKLCAALATLAFGSAVAASGYEAGSVITDAMREGIWAACTVIPAISALLSVVPLFWYAVDERTLVPHLAAVRAERRAARSRRTSSGCRRISNSGMVQATPRR
jgi:GPH family glycoside/pentoside/hexuronide:cation symporter